MGQTQSGFVPHRDLDDELDQYGAELQLWAQPSLQGNGGRSFPRAPALAPAHRFLPNGECQSVEISWPQLMRSLRIPTR